MQSLSLIQQQKLQQKLSPAQIQVVRMLELPASELMQRVNEELQDNPALEEEDSLMPTTSDEYETPRSQEEDEFQNPLQNDDFNYDDYISDDETPEYRMHDYAAPAEEENRDIPFSAGTSFGEYLKSQVYLTNMDKTDRHVAKFVVGNIDEDGYLRRSAEELVDDLAFREGIIVSDEKMADIIAQIKTFDPPGVGAKDLCECLLLQLRQKESSASIETAELILEKCFDDFSHHRYDRLKEKLSLTEESLKDAIQEITRLSPKPGSAWQGTIYEKQGATIIPDFYVENRDGELVVILNHGDIPYLRISQDYKNMLEDYSKGKEKQSAQMKEATLFVKQKIDSAKWFIDAIKQRNETLLKTMKAIVETQKEFFYEGDESYLKPMILQVIADKTCYDVSTISRVSNSKYVQTEFGIYPLKFFFSESMLNVEGDEISTREIKKVLKEVIDNEDKHSPLSDEKLVSVMRAQGYNLARRTVAKYRELLGLPIARLRREV